MVGRGETRWPNERASEGEQRAKEDPYSSKSIQDSVLVASQFYFLERRRVRIVPALILLHRLPRCVRVWVIMLMVVVTAASIAVRSLQLPSISSFSKT